MESMTSVTVAILFECTIKEFRFSCETSLGADGSSWMYQDGQYRMLIGQVVV